MKKHEQQNMDHIIDRRNSSDRSYSGSWFERHGGKVGIGAIVVATAFSFLANSDRSNIDNQTNDHPAVTIIVEDSNN